MEKLATAILSRLSASYPAYIELEVCRNESDIKQTSAFKRAVAYLEEKALVELRDVKEGFCDGIFGDIRATAAGLDYLNARSRKVRATFIQ